MRGFRTIRTGGLAGFILAITMLLRAGLLDAEEIKPAADAPKPLSPRESLERFQLAKGLKIELVASEPLIADPTGIAWDEQGRLFVCEIHGYNLEGHLDIIELNKTGKLDKKIRRIYATPETLAEARKQTYGRVKLLHDTDGDGRMDRADTWADDLPACFGIVPARGGIIVITAFRIIYLNDSTGDGKADIRETLFDGFEMHIIERAINNPRWGQDNWIYVAGANRGASVTGPALKGKVNLGRNDFRFKADGSAIEPVTGTNHTFGLSLTDSGDRFLISTGSHALYAIPLPYRYLIRNPHVPVPGAVANAGQDPRVYPISKPHPWRVARSKDPRWVKFYGRMEATANGYLTSACGQLVYRAQLLGEKYRGNHFACDPQQNMVRRSELRRDGAGYRTSRPKEEKNSEFLASTDQWFRPNGLRTGPDGALYVVDFYREIIEDYSAIPRYLQQQYGLVKGDDRGRIWRISPAADKYKPPRKLSAMKPSELAARINHPTPWQRFTATRLLIEKKSDRAAGELKEALRSGTNPQGRLQCLYALDGIGSLSPGDLLTGLGDRNYSVRLHALRLADSRLGEDPRLLEKIAAMVSDPDPLVRLQVAMSLGSSSRPAAVSALVRLTEERLGERWMRAAVLSSVKNIAGDLLGGLLSRKKTNPDGGLAESLAMIAGSRGRQAELTTLLEALERLEKDRGSLLVHCLKGLYRGLEHGAAKSLDDERGRRSLVELLKRAEGESLSLGLRVAGRLGLSGSKELEKFYEKIAADAVDEKRSEKERRKALEFLAAGPFKTLEGISERLLAPTESPGIQLAALGALSSMEDPRAGPLLLKNWKNYSPSIQEKAIEAVFSRENRLGALVAGLEEKTIPVQSLSALRIDRLLKNPDSELRARAQKVIEGMRVSSDRGKVIERYTAALGDSADPVHGREVFLAQCAKCHQVAGLGHPVGPDLAQAKNRPDDSLLLDVLNPSGIITSGFDTYTLVTKNGGSFSGVVASESPTSVKLLWAEGNTATVLRKDITLLQAAGKSLMPENLDQAVSAEDLAAVFAWLREIFGQPTTLQRLEHDDIELKGSWETERNPQYSEKIAALTTTHGDTASFTFEGTGITWVGARTFNGGVFRWVIDEGTPQEVSGKVNTWIKGIERYKVIPLKEALRPGKHTFKCTMESGKEIYIDAFDIMVPLKKRGAKK